MKGMVKNLLSVLLALVMLLSIAGALAEGEVSDEPAGQSIFAQMQSEAKKEEKPYTWVRDGLGTLVLEENGDPRVIVAEGEEIPVAYARYTDGTLILDQNGDPIPTYTVPANAQLMATQEDAQNSGRIIDIYMAWQEETPAIGGHVLLVAVPRGYDNLTFTVTWQQSSDNENWTDLLNEYPEDASVQDMLRYLVEVTADNYDDFWRVRISITGTMQ